MTRALLGPPRLAILVATIAVMLMRTAATTRADPGAAQPSPATSTVLEEAQASFRAGLELYAGGDYAAALDEFERAYRLSPTYRILFNLAQVAYQRRDLVLALHYFTRYLDEGGNAIEPARRIEVQREIGRLRLRIGELEIVGAPAGSEIYVDDVRVGVTPLPVPVAATAGRRRIEVVESTGHRVVRHVEVTPGGRLRVNIGDAAERVPPPVVAAPSPPPPDPNPIRLTAHAATPTGRSLWVPGLIGVAAVGTAVTAVITGRRALALSNQLQHDLNDYPVSREHLDDVSADQRRWSLATDGSLLATAILGAVALYALSARSSAATGP